MIRMLIFTNAAFGFSLFGVGVWIPALFERHYHLDTNKLLATNIDLLVEAVKAPPRQSAEGSGR